MARNYLILGHENFGVVVDVGRRVTGFAAGDFVVSTVRRPCGLCPQCKAGENDMCSSGRYTERGIMRRHGFMAQYYVESPRFMNKIPKSLRNIGVLLEPMSIVEKGIDHAFLVQRRLVWKPKTGMVLGAGPVGLLAAAVLRARGLATTVIGRENPADRRAQVARMLGAEYVSTTNLTLADIANRTGAPDIVVEATGQASVAFDAMGILALNGALCLLSVTGGQTTLPEPIDLINRRLVLGNQVVFGSVNANPRHFAMGIKDFARLEKKYPGALAGLLTTRIPWENYDSWFTERGAGIKATLEIA